MRSFILFVCLSLFACSSTDSSELDFVHRDGQPHLIGIERFDLCERDAPCYWVAPNDGVIEIRPSSLHQRLWIQEAGNSDGAVLEVGGYYPVVAGMPYAFASIFDTDARVSATAAASVYSNLRLRFTPCSDDCDAVIGFDSITGFQVTEAFSETASIFLAASGIKAVTMEFQLPNRDGSCVIQGIADNDTLFSREWQADTGLLWFDIPEPHSWVQVVLKCNSPGNIMIRPSF